MTDFLMQKILERATIEKRRHSIYTNLASKEEREANIKILDTPEIGFISITGYAGVWGEPLKNPKIDKVLYSIEWPIHQLYQVAVELNHPIFIDGHGSVFRILFFDWKYADAYFHAIKFSNQAIFNWHKKLGFFRRAFIEGSTPDLDDPTSITVLNTIRSLISR